ncbi:excalibur calcium-binding domain-containing protein [Sphingobium sp. LMC3-1-1.1]
MSVGSESEAEARRRGSRRTGTRRHVSSGSNRSYRSYGSGGEYYANCSHARAAGAAPIMADEAGYSRRLDRDGDGVACE